PLINVVTKFSYVNSLAYLFGLFTRMLGFDEGEENAVEKLAGSGSFDKKLSDSTSKIMAFRNGEIVIQSARMRPEIFKKHEKTDIAYALQERLAEVVREMVLFFFKRNPCDTICFGGGLFMNRGIRRFLKECFDERFFVPDVCGDGSLAEGAAFHVSVNNGI
ncbi:MAG: hypothetical protein FJ088_10905, partial [Deltaproteobacteria bacterium]|nr:hypothetical protein [Deltaproteobacteria bacterium]